MTKFEKLVLRALYILLKASIIPATDSLTFTENRQILLREIRKEIGD